MRARPLFNCIKVAYKLARSTIKMVVEQQQQQQPVERWPTKCEWIFGQNQ